MSNAAARDSHPLDTMLAISDVVTTQRYAQIYARMLTLDTPTIAELSENLDSSTTTVYEDLHHLVESGILCSIENAVRESDHSVLASFLRLLSANRRTISRN